MTGVRELRNVQVLGAAPEVIRVSVRGERTQLDVALPADVAVAAFLPELVRLVGSRDNTRDDELTDRDERRTFWVLSGVDGDAQLAPGETLRAAGVNNGDLLRISAQRALSPPTLYDDVVDAAARLNRAAYVAWNATAAAVMAFAGLWLCTAVWVYFLLADAMSAHRTMVVAGASFTIAALVTGAALGHRALGRSDVAAALGWPAVALSAAVGWVLAAGYGDFGRAAACAVLLVLSAVYYRVIGSGHAAYIAAAVVFAFGGLALAGSGLGWRADALAAAVTTAAAMGCLAVPALTARLGRPSTPTDQAATKGKHSQFDNPFTTAAAETDSGAAMPSAEQVWARVRTATLSRAGLLAGLAAVVTAGAAVLVRLHTGWPTVAFALGCAAVLTLRSRRVRTVPERSAMAVPALGLVVIVCVQAQAGAAGLWLAAAGAPVAVGVIAVLAGLLLSKGRWPRWVPTVAAYLDYAAVALLIPLALWPLGLYDRSGLW